MEDVSQHKENWLIQDRENIPDGANLANLTGKYGMATRNSTVSALGREYESSNDLSLEITPMCARPAFLEFGTELA